MKKICYIVTISLTIKSFFIPQLKHLADNGLDVNVVCSYDKDLQNLLGDKITYHPIEMPRGISFSGSLKAIKELTDYFREENFDLIQYSTPNAAFYASIAGKRAGIRVRNYHLMGFRYLGADGLGKAILKRMEKTACSNSTHIECVSKSNLEIGVADKIFKREKATIVWNGSTGGVDLARFDYSKREAYRCEIRNKLNLSADDFVFGFVGRITRDKGINEIFSAFSKIDNAKLLMVGNLEGIETLNQDLYRQSQSDANIIYTGSVSDVEKYFAAMDVLLLPSYREGFGNVIIEAAAMGTPAIVSNIPGPIDAVDKYSAYLVNVRDSESLYRAMFDIMNSNYSDMGGYAATFAREKFDSAMLSEQILIHKITILK